MIIIVPIIKTILKCYIIIIVILVNSFVNLSVIMINEIYSICNFTIYGNFL